MRAKQLTVSIGVAVFVCRAITSATETISLNFESPRAVALGAKGSMYVLDATASAVQIVARDPGPRLLATFGAQGSGSGALDHPTDLTVDRAGNVLVADAGNYRIAVFRPSGELLREVALPGTPILQRMVSLADGSTRVLLWDGGSQKLVVKTLDAKYQSGASFSVEAFCPLRGSNAPIADLAADSEGNLWIIDLYGCQDQYTLRKYSSSGTPLGTWSHAAGQISLDAQARHGYMVRIIGGLFGADGRMFVVLGGGGAETGGLDVDVWTVGGAYLRRSKLVGPARSMIRTAVSGKTVYVADSDGLKSIFAIDVSGL